MGDWTRDRSTLRLSRAGRRGCRVDRASRPRGVRCHPRRSREHAGFRVPELGRLCADGRGARPRGIQRIRVRRPHVSGEGSANGRVQHAALVHVGRRERRDRSVVLVREGLSVRRHRGRREPFRPRRARRHAGDADVRLQNQLSGRKRGLRSVDGVRGDWLFHRAATGIQLRLRLIHEDVENGTGRPSGVSRSGSAASSSPLRSATRDA